MRKLFPSMTECPSQFHVAAGIFYCGFSLISLPFLLLLFMFGSYDNYPVLVWCELIYHALNFVVMVLLYRRHFYDSFLQVELYPGRIIKNVLLCALVIVIAALEISRQAQRGGDSLSSLAIYGALPIVEIEMFALPDLILQVNPVFGVLCFVVFTPVTISCLYYGTVFAPICNRRPWLAYLVTAVVIFLPRLCNGLTHWVLEQQVMLYLCQLPIHMVACWSYQKNDTIWAPIGVHMTANLVGCTGWLVLLNMHG